MMQPASPIGDFTPQADSDAKARPTYPAALVDRPLDQAGVRRGEPRAYLAGQGLAMVEVLYLCRAWTARRA